MRIDILVLDERIVQALEACGPVSISWCERLIWDGPSLTDHGFLAVVEGRGTCELRLRVDGGTLPECHVLTQARIYEGLRLLAVVDPESFGRVLHGTGDAEDGDRLLQFCALGELVYG